MEMEWGGRRRPHESGGCGGGGGGGGGAPDAHARVTSHQADALCGD